MRPLTPAALLILGAFALSGCSQPVNCSGLDYITACVPNPDGVEAAKGPAVTPAVAPSAVMPPAAAAPESVSLGEPGQFADVDDRQCRSYGLTFGTRDYADCRIRLSAQHRGLDPNIGAGTHGP